MMKQLLNLSGQELEYSLSSLHYRLGYAWRQPQMKVLVNGSPKTGTTWMLKMVESLPGYRTVGNFDGQIERYRDVQPGEVVHGHDWYTPELAGILADRDIRVILMVRDPRDQLVSRLFHILRVTNHAWHQRLKALSLDDALLLLMEGREEQGLPGMRTMIELTQSWLNGGADAVCVRYEELLGETEREFRRVLEHLRVSAPNSLVQAIVSRNQFERMTNGRRFWRQGRKQGQADPNSHFRKGITGDWKNHFKEVHILKFKEVAGDKLVELGYERSLDW
jgi:hypothetical protein